MDGKRLVLALSLLVGGCGTHTTGTVGPGNDDGGNNNGGGDMAVTNPPTDGGMNGGGDGGPLYDSDAFWANDPPPKYCALDGGAFPPPMVPGGTPDCPDDKNREGCPCPKVGMRAACWPGLRANRGLGVCMDGTTTCQQVGELGQAWGPCMGYVLPDPNATSGKAACKCFSSGQWKIDNLSPCFYDSGQGGGSGGAASTIVMNGMAQCYPPQNNMVVKPPSPWSMDTVTADCEGHFKLCYTLKAGNGMMPSQNDCVLAQSCVEADYVQVNQAMPFPDLPAWVATDNNAVACAEKFAQSGGYGEMSVTGLTVMCDMLDKVFNRVIYCPLACNQNPMMQGCQNCMQGGGGNF